MFLKNLLIVVMREKIWLNKFTHPSIIINNIIAAKHNRIGDQFINVAYKYIVNQRNQIIIPHNGNIHIYQMGNQQGKLDPSLLSEKDRQRLQEGKPLNIAKGVHITKNPNTGKLQGFPQQWVNNYEMPLNIDNAKNQKTNHLKEVIRPEADLPESILKLINSQPIYVSKPTNFVHKIHLQVDLNSPCGIKGLTPGMQALFHKNQIDGQLIKTNPSTMIQILNNLQLQEKIPQNALLTDTQFKECVRKVQFFNTNPSQIYRFSKQLGKGAQCTVYKTFNRKNDKEVYAVRVMKVMDQEVLQKIRVQAAVMLLCSNPNIINYKESYYFQDCLFMFIEYMDGGSLTQFIEQYVKALSESMIAFILRDILLGIDALHRHKQIHRDLKSDNILVDKQGQIKVADFGFAIQLTKQHQKRKSLVGTPAWMAPELIKKEEYNELIDVWSIGVIAVQLAEGEPPYLRLPALKAMYLISTKQPYRLKKGKYSVNFCDFVQKCLEKDVLKRWQIKKLLRHPFIGAIGDGIKERQKFKQMIKNKKTSPLQQLNQS